MSKKIKCAIIGCGVIAPSHAEGYAGIKDVEIVWACDLVKDKADNLAVKYKIPKTTVDFREVLADPDLDCISICTDHASHSMIAVEAFKKGKHVLCEKALASTHQGLENMMVAYKKHKDLVFSGVFQNRYNKVYQLMRKLLADSSLGILLTADLQFRCYRSNEYYDSDEWRGTWSKEGGSLLINQAIHAVDLLGWMTGGVKYLSGTYSNLTHGEHIETEDTAVATLRYKNGALGTISATSSSKIEWDMAYSFNGSKGSIELRNGEIQKTDLEDKALSDTISSEVQKIKDEAKVEGTGKSYYGPSHSCQIADFVEAIRTGREPFITGESARHTVDMVLGIYQSHRDKKWVKI
ncbi:MAG: Gfo/Idh/MocA family oxidoreductase [Victivallales bacterium]